MAKYGDLIKQARQPSDQITSKPDNQIVDELDDQSDQVTSKPDDQITREPVTQKEVNLCVKVPENLRRHWAAEAKRQGVTMTEIIVNALAEKFGKPS